MKLTVKPVSLLKGIVELPASKSYSIRAYMVAACGGTSTIVAPSNCDDAVVARRAAQALGAKVARLDSRRFKIEAGKKRPDVKKVNVKESGTVLRFILPLAARLGVPSKIVGEGTLKGRPNRFLTKALRSMGVSVKGQGKQESVPIVIKGGSLCPGRIEIDGSISSQFISALLITCPLLDKPSRIVIKGRKVVSQDYITMTRQILKETGIKIGKRSPREFTVKAGQRFVGLKQFTVPSDYGLAAFHMAAAALVSSDVKLKGSFRDRFVQADGQIFSLMRKMGVRLVKDSNAIKIKGPFILKGGNFSLKTCPDLVPIMAVLAMFARGRTKLTDIGHARVKESDRITDLRRELVKVGARISEQKDTMIIDPCPTYKTNLTLDPHKDHRLAMAFSVLGLKLGVTVKDIECVAKSYPDFARDFRRIGAKITRN